MSNGAYSAGAVARPVEAPRLPRLAWVDATRGYSVAAVVVFHVVLWWVLAAPTDIAAPGERLWSEVNGWLGSVRMPVLLAASGLVMSRQIRSGLHRSTTVFRSANNYYLYLVWLALYAVFFLFVREPDLPHRIDGLAGVAAQVVIPRTTLWYVFGLAVYIPILAAAKRAPTWVVFALLVPLSVWAHGLSNEASFWPRILTLFVFFAMGVYGATQLRWLGERATPVMFVVAVIVALGATMLGHVLIGPVLGGVLFLVRGTAFMVLAVVTVALAVRWRVALVVGASLGRHTLAVYVLHPLLICLLIAVTAGPLRSVKESVLGSTVGSLVTPLLAAVALIAVSIGIEAGARRLRLDALWGMPTAWRARFGR